MVTASDNDVSEKLDLIAKLLFMQVRLQAEALIEKEITTDKQKKLYSALDGNSNIKAIAKSTKLSEIWLRQTLPGWERKGIILSYGKGNAKRYVNLDNLDF